MFERVIKVIVNTELSHYADMLFASRGIFHNFNNYCMQICFHIN